MFDDEKVKLIRTMPEGDKIVVIWVQILCLAGKINDGGLVYMGQNLAYSDEMLATILGHPLNVMRVAIQTLEQFEMIEVHNDGKIDVINWSKHQSTDKMERIKNQNRERQQRYYYRNKLRELGVNIDIEGFPEDLLELKTLTEQAEEPNVSITLANGTEVRSKKKEVRSKKLDKDIQPNESADSDLVSDFEKLWKLYPRKERKSDALKAYKKAIKAGATNKQIQDGIISYKKKIDAEKIEHQFIAQGGTWFNQERWNDEYVISKPSNNNFKNKQQYQEPVPEWLDKQQNNDTEIDMVSFAADAKGVEYLKQRMKEMGILDS